MTDPSTTAVSPPRFTLGEGQAAFDAACDRARDESWANRLFDRDTTPLVDRSGRPGRHRGPPRLAGRPGSLHGPDRRPRRLRRRGRGGRVRDRGRGRDGRQQPGPRRPASDVRVAGRVSRAAHPRFDGPGLRLGGRRRPRSAHDADRHRVEVRHDHRTQRLPGRRLDARRSRDGRPEAPPLLRQRRRHHRRRSRTRARASRRSPTTTTSARSS